MISMSSRVDSDQSLPTLELKLAQSSEAPSIARAAIAGFFEDHRIASNTLASVMLLVSEIVTNAVIHPNADPTTSIRLSARLDSGCIRVEVTDHGARFIPVPRDPAGLSGGYGLFLVEKEATRWGVSRQQGTTVWFELAVNAHKPNRHV